MKILCYTLGSDNRKAKKFEQSYITKRPFKYSIKVFDDGQDGYDPTLMSDFDITTLCPYIDEDFYWARKYAGDDHYKVYYGRQVFETDIIITYDIISQENEVIDILDELNRQVLQDLKQMSRTSRD